MRKSLEFQLKNTELFIRQLIKWGDKFEHFILLNSNSNKTGKHRYPKYDVLAGCCEIKSPEISNVNKFESLRNFTKKNKDWLFGFLTYDLKNELENLESLNTDLIQFPDMHFFIPKYVFIINNNVLRIEFLPEFTETDEIENTYHDIVKYYDSKVIKNDCGFEISGNFIKTEYLDTIDKLKKHILKGDIYEVNFCMEFYSKNVQIDPTQSYLKLNDISPAPFSCFLKNNDKYLLSSSPERFLAKRQSSVISQPIKGTVKRGLTKEEDSYLKNWLENNEKERAENIMIVDLVRNDLSKTAKNSSVKVQELCKIYSYEHVHQMVSTICSEINEELYDIIDVVEKAFPMGSMTGAPKIRAMKLIEKYEKSKRGLFSGSVGYISPSQDFDFNVIIRSILYNKSNRHLSFSVGSAITYKSEAEKEYEECLLKAQALIKTLNA